MGFLDPKYLRLGKNVLAAIHIFSVIAKSIAAFDNTDQCFVGL